LLCTLCAVCGLLLMVSIPAHACTCAGPTPTCSVFTQSPVIFRGRVSEITPLSPPSSQVKNLDGTTSSIGAPGKLKVQFEVAEVFRGNPGAEVTVFTEEQSSACGFPFKTGAEYIVFTYENKATGELSTSRCSNTHELDPAKEDPDVAWFRERAKLPSGATVFGSIFIPANRKPLPSSQISIKGTENHDVVPDENGKYSIAGLAAGQYTVSATAPSGFVTAGARTISVADRGCAEVDWPVFYDGHIGGRVTDRSGAPIAKLPMELSRRDANAWNGFSMVGLADTDVEGRFEFKEVPPGEYFLTANSLGPSPQRPYPRVYFPNADKIEIATGVQLGTSEKLSNVDMILPVAWKPVAVRARVVLNDGRPASHVEVIAYDLTALWSVEPATAETDENGQAMLTVYEGRAYYLTSLISGGIQQRCGGPLKFTAQNGMKLGTIRIEHNWGNCLAQLDPKFVPPR